MSFENCGLPERRRHCDGTGPECPKCHRIYTDEEGRYSDERNIVEIECDECHLVFEVHPRITVTTHGRATFSQPRYLDSISSRMLFRY